MILLRNCFTMTLKYVSNVQSTSPQCFHSGKIATFDRPKVETFGLSQCNSWKYKYLQSGKRTRTARRATHRTPLQYRGCRDIYRSAHAVFSHDDVTVMPGSAGAVDRTALSRGMSREGDRPLMVPSGRIFGNMRWKTRRGVET